MDSTNNMGKKTRAMFSSDNKQALRQAMIQDAIGSTAVGSTGFITDALANEADADSLIGKGLNAVDNATSVGYWSWVVVGVVNGKGWDSFESIQSDAKKKIKYVNTLCDECVDKLLAAIADHNASLSHYQKGYKQLDNLIARIESAMDLPTGILASK